MSPTAAGRALAADPRLLLGIGTLDPLDGDLPLGTLSRIVDAVVHRVSAASRVLYAPTFAYGGLTREGRGRPGTAGLQRKTLHRAVNELLGGWEDHGIEEFIVVTAQRSEPHMDALLMAFTSRARTTVFDLLSLDVSDLVEPETGRRPGAVEARVTAHLDHEQRYGSGVPGTPLPTPAPPEARQGGAIISRWVRSIAAALPEAGGPHAAADV